MTNRNLAGIRIPVTACICEYTNIIQEPTFDYLLLQYLNLNIIYLYIYFII